MQLIAIKQDRTFKIKGETQKECLRKLTKKVRDTRGFVFNWIQEPIKTN